MSSALTRLQREVLDAGLCTACGGCLGLCPYLVSLGDQVAGLGECRLQEGRCHRYCPRAGGVTETSSYSGSIGRHLQVYWAQSTDGADGRDVAAPLTAGLPQHGGVATTLLAVALQVGLIDSAVVSGGSAGVAEPFAAFTEAEIRSSAGSRFAVAPVVAEVNRALAAGCGRLGVAALPCQASALGRVRAESTVVPEERVSVVLGLFCTWGLGQREWRALREGRLGQASLRRLEIPPPPASVLVVERQDGLLVEIPLEEVREAVRPGCRVCADMTAEDADLSLGMVEGRAGWNTLIVRSPRGQELVDAGLAAGRIKLERADHALADLREASLGKKRRAAAEAGRRAGDEPHLERLRELGGVVGP